MAATPDTAFAPYGQSLSLLTDLYQLTMAYGYWKEGTDAREAVFHLYFRKPPFNGGYTLAAGLATAIDWLARFRFEPDDLAYLSTLVGADGTPLFEPAFLDHLAAMRFTCDIDAVPEGTVVFPNQPLVRVRGPLIQCQLLETALLNIVNFQSLVATKAARVCLAAQGEPVLEFGLRRAQGIDGGLAASRAAFVGGVAATSNVLAGKLYGIPVRGTHAHSWVMSFESEREAFERYAEALPNNCVFLVDTYDTLEGVRRACEVGLALRDRGHEMIGVRLDSGDLAYLSIEARRLLDEAGFPNATIVASNDLNEHLIRSLKDQGARINVWGVGTQLATAYDQPALGGVYKLGALRRPGEPWRYKVKLSENPSKISTPGVLQVRRYYQDGMALADALYDESRGIPAGDMLIVDPGEITHQKRIPTDTPHEDLLVPVFRAGGRVYDPPALTESRARAQAELARFHAGVKRLENPHAYPAGVEKSLYDFKLDLVLAAKGVKA
ncbi:MAG: nicotinate phosphoribosyltransferase [Candidatus Sericytochromatia bacterium]|nr:nicotinate phosphoribosyltransferase [Candidatus Sericytochromatia bacterium]